MKYGHRWIAEIVFSTMKKTIDEYVFTTKFENMVKVMMIIRSRNPCIICLEKYSISGIYVIGR